MIDDSQFPKNISHVFVIIISNACLADWLGLASFGVGNQSDIKRVKADGRPI